MILQAVADIWWPQSHRDVVLLAKSCTQCQNAGKSLKTIQKQTEYGKIPAAENHNDETAIDFAGPFKIAPDNKNYLLVSIDHKTNWPDAKFMRRPTTDKVIEFLNMNIAEFGIPKRIRTFTATIFRSEKFKQFCTKILQTTYRMHNYDQRGNGKIEGLIRTLNERLGTDKTVILIEGTTGLSRLLFALRTAATTNGNSPFERVFGRKPNPVNCILTEKPNKCSENDKQLQLSPEELPKNDDSTVFLRDRTKNTKLESQFKKKRGTIAAESSHTITIETPRGGQTYSKRDLAKPTTKMENHPAQNKQPRGKHSFERKLAALKEAEKAKPEKKQTTKTLCRERLQTKRKTEITTKTTKTQKITNWPTNKTRQH